MVTYTLKVIELRKETEDTVSVVFKQPGLRKLKYKAGQYLTLIFKINGRRYLRPYSFSSSPEADKDLVITVKRIPGGIVSNHICDILKVGDSIEVLPPMGEFCIQDTTWVGVYCFWGAGSGITPLISIIKSLLHSTKNYKIVLIYGSRDLNSIVFYEELQKLSIQYQHQFEIFYCLSQEESLAKSPNIFQGRIDEKYVKNIFNSQNIPIDAPHFICGPQGVKNCVKKTLSDIGVNQNSIFSEDFELVLNPEDFNNVFTQKVKVEFQHNIVEVEVIKGKTILDAILDLDLKVPYSCQTGTCKECKATVMNGEVKMIGIHDSELEQMEERECLLCCSLPLSQDVVLNIK